MSHLPPGYPHRDCQTADPAACPSGVVASLLEPQAEAGRSRHGGTVSPILGDGVDPLLRGPGALVAGHAAPLECGRASRALSRYGYGLRASRGGFRLHSSVLALPPP